MRQLVARKALRAASRIAQTARVGGPIFNLRPRALRNLGYRAQVALTGIAWRIHRLAKGGE